MSIVLTTTIFFIPILFILSCSSLSSQNQQMNNFAESEIETDTIKVNKINY